ncbi:MAG: glycosyltransferase, partial [Stackebrandtia sp.]
ALSTPDTPVGSLYGYAAPWKDPATLLAAGRHTSAAARIIIAGPFWDDPAQAGVDIKAEVEKAAAGTTLQITVVADYLDAPARRALTAASDFAVFPYRHQPTFQGSGAIADYLAHAVPVLATDVANMAELVGDAGMIVPPADPLALAEALDLFSADHKQRYRLREAAQRRAHRFTADHHARRCLRLYELAVAYRGARR